MKGQVEERLKFYETGAIPAKNSEVMTKVIKSLKKRSSDEASEEQRPSKKSKSSDEEKKGKKSKSSSPEKTASKGNEKVKIEKKSSKKEKKAGK